LRAFVEQRVVEAGECMEEYRCANEVVVLNVLDG
jgi:hypothetical protein